MSGGFIAHGIAYLEMPPEYPGYLCTDLSSPLSSPLNIVDCAPKTPTDHTPPANETAPTFCDSTTYVYDSVNFEAHPANIYNMYT